MGLGVEVVRIRQAAAYARQIRKLPQVKEAVRCLDGGTGRDDYAVRVVDHVGNVSYLDDVCETRSLIGIWKGQAGIARDSVSGTRASPT